MWEKNKRTTEFDKSTIKYNVGTTQFEGGIIKCEKKNTSTTECGKSTAKCEASIVQRDNETIKCEKK